MIQLNNDIYANEVVKTEYVGVRKILLEQPCRSIKKMATISRAARGCQILSWSPRPHEHSGDGGLIVADGEEEKLVVSFVPRTTTKPTAEAAESNPKRDIVIYFGGDIQDLRKEMEQNFETTR